MLTQNVHLIFWLPSSGKLQDGTPFTVSPDYIPTIRQFFQDLGGTGLYGMLTQYYQDRSGSGRQFIRNSVKLTGTVVHGEDYPKDCAFNTNCLSDATVRNLIRAAIGATGWSTGADESFLVYLAPGESVCKIAGVTDCYPSSSGGCAYHDDFSAGLLGPDSNIIYGVIPYVTPQNAHCFSGSGPYAPSTNMAVSFSSHEDSEMVTDPGGDGWFAGSLPGQDEIGDRCSTDLGVRPLIYDFGNANEKMYGNYYLTQTEWSNLTDACVRNDGMERLGDVTVAGGASAGPPGSYVEIGGEDFQPGEIVTIVYRTGLSDPATIPLCSPPLQGSTTVRSDGSVYCADQIPDDPNAGDPGPHQIIMTGVASGVSVTTTFTVTAKNGDWTKFRNDLVNSGYNSQETTLGVGNVSGLTKAWSYPTGSRVDSSAAVVNGVVYVGSDGKKGSSGSVVAFDAASGAVRWSHPIKHGVASSPAVVHGVVYVGSDEYGKIYALDASTGKEIWNYSTEGAVVSSPAVANGVVYVGSDDGKIYALDASTGALRWSYTTAGYVVSSPAVVQGVVYVGSYDHKMYALDAVTGTLLWSHITGGIFLASPAVVNGVVYAGSSDFNVYALDAGNGDVLWSYKTGGFVFSSAAVAHGVVYVGSWDGKVYALNATTGALIWHTSGGPYIYSSPAVANGVVYVGSYDDRLYALDASTGATLWSYRTGNVVAASPAIVNGMLYAGSWDRRFYAFGLSS